MLMGAGAAAAIAGLVAVTAAPAQAAAVSLLETGSSLLYPLFNL
jgi:hypothetical protein